ncbi:hypothetical protein RB195_002239 [Necator americanus]|uniref:C-CAP/cofactor C-like domain-containing protein n=1 Tax=Necator americanus TaxID=51031 RepID=A0ABR1DJ33_NECAM
MSGTWLRHHTTMELQAFRSSIAHHAADLSPRQRWRSFGAYSKEALIIPITTQRPRTPQRKRFHFSTLTMPWLCCHRQKKCKREDQYKVTDEAEEQQQSDEPKFSWERRPRMDIDKYRIHDLDSATEVRRGVAGQPMAIESCKNSNLLVLDHTSTVTVDDCTDCLIVLAPCAGSVYIRDCQSCTVLVACQQLRTRDCRTLCIALHCATQPIIEETSNVVFHPLTLHYDSIIDDMTAARLSLFNRHSNTVHDFTPERGSQHYRICNEVLSLSPGHVAALNAHGVSTDVPDSAIPFHEQRTEPGHFYYAGCSDDVPRLKFVERCHKVAHTVSTTSTVSLVNTCEVDLHKHGTKIPFVTKGFGTLVVLEICGATEEIEELMKNTDGGFKKVQEEHSRALATALSIINQISLS